MKRKQLILNLSTSILFFLVNLCVSFFITPIIVSKIGSEAYGFIGLTNNMVNYASILTVAINSVAGRFLIILFNKNDIKGANIYFNSIFGANLIMAFILLVIAVITTVSLQYFINIPFYLIRDVKITFFLTCLNFIITLVILVFTVAAYVSDRIDISSIINLKAICLRLLLLVIVFSTFKPKIYFIAISVLGFTLISGIENIRYFQKLLPQIKLNLKLFNMNSIKDVFSLGIWNSINNMSQILIDGMDLFIVNLFIGSGIMGIVSISKSIPNIIFSFIGVIVWVYEPKFTMFYAADNIKNLIDTVKESMHVTSLIILPIISGVIIFGYDFYSLWLPSMKKDDIILIQQLTVIGVIPLLISGLNRSLNNLFSVYKKLKMPVIVSLCTGMVSFIIVFICVKYTTLGVFAIAGVSSILLVMQYLIFTPVYAAHILKIDKFVFFKSMLRGMFNFIVIMFMFFLIRQCVVINSWIRFIYTIIVCTCLGLLSGYMILINKTERRRIYKSIFIYIKNILFIKSKKGEENFEKRE